MASDPSFVAHALDLVSLLEGVESRATFVSAGCRRWQYVNKKVRMENTGYFRPPDDAHEDAEAMLPWARLALEAALRARAAKAAKAARGKKRKGADRAAKPA